LGGVEQSRDSRAPGVYLPGGMPFNYVPENVPAPVNVAGQAEDMPTHLGAGGRQYAESLTPGLLRDDADEETLRWP